MKFIKKLKDKVKNLFNGDYRGIAILFVLQFILFITVKPIRYDDAFYIESITGVPVLSFVSSRYKAWTSRVLIEATLGFIFRFSKYIWTFGTIICMTLIGYSIAKIFVKKENKKDLIMMVLWLVLLYPIERMSSAGWAATTVNYIWPLALGLFSLISLRKAWDKEKIKPIIGIFYALATAYACNQEQVCVVLLVTYILFTIILTVRDKKKVSPFMYLQSIIAIASLIFILTTPGNSIRQEEEIITYFPEFYGMSVIEKLALGITSTMGEMLAKYSITFTIFSLMILIYIWNNYKDRLIRGISAIPFTASIVLSYGSSITENVSVAVAWARSNFKKSEVLLKPSTYTYIGSYVELIISLAVIVSIFICLFLIFKKLKNNIAFYIFGCGLVTRLIMGFSPTIFVSENRTCIFLEFACLICTLLIWQEFIKKAEKKTKTKAYNIVAWISIIQYIISLSFIWLTHIYV
jgi:hypothetical protein